MRSRSVEMHNPGSSVVPPSDSSSSSESSDDEGVAEEMPQAAIDESSALQEEQDPYRWRKFFVRSLALLCAMALSIGSHFGSYFLGPLKSRLSREIGTSNAEFSLMIAAFDLNSTWTPLLGGLLVCRFGTARSSVVATLIILLGQVILLLGDFLGNVVCMSLGLFIFGLGISPLAVVQETIVVRFFASHGLGVSLAIGLIAGKGASFVSARISYPLSQNFGPHAPFVVATLLCLFSFGVNLIYLSTSSWLAKNAGVKLEPGEETEKEIIGARMTAREAATRVHEKKKVKLRDMQRFGDVFWLYLGINVLCGSIWSPFTHLASNIIEQRYSMSEGDASEQASLLLAGSLILYPLCGIITDRLKHGSVVFILFALSSFLTLICYGWLVLPPSWTQTPLPAMLSFGAGHGFSTLLLVIIVAHILPLSHVSTGLGAHKSIEKAGSTMSQTLAGLLLDIKGKKRAGAESLTVADSLQSIQRLLVIYFLINLVQFAGTLLLWRDVAHLKKHPRHNEASSSSASYQRVASDDVEEPVASTSQPHLESAVISASDDEDGEVESSSRRKSDGAKLAGHLRGEGSWTRGVKPLLLPPNVSHTNYQSSSLTSPVRSRNRYHPGLVRSTVQRKRGKAFMLLYFALILFTWVLFLSTAMVKLNKGPKPT